MPEDARVAADGSHIRVDSVGWRDLADVRSTLDRIFTLQSEHGINHVLVTSIGFADPMPRSIAYDGAKLTADRLAARVRIAIVVTAVEPRHKFFENVAVNRGAALQFFQDESAALEWLARGNSLIDR